MNKTQRHYNKSLLNTPNKQQQLTISMNNSLKKITKSKTFKINSNLKTTNSKNKLNKHKKSKRLMKKQKYCNNKVKNY